MLRQDIVLNEADFEQKVEICLQVLVAVNVELVVPDHFIHALESQLQDVAIQAVPEDIANELHTKSKTVLGLLPRSRLEDSVLFG